MPFTYPYPRPAVTCDVVAFTIRAGELSVLLVQRGREPFRGAWALPGGFVEENEPLPRAAARELYEETGLSGVRLEEIGAFGEPGRDPRGRTISIAYATYLVAEAQIKAGDDADDVAWKSLRSLDLTDPSARRAGKPAKRQARGEARVPLAFDHAKIVLRAYRRLCRYLDDPVHDGSFDLVPPRFTLAELQRLYETVLGRELSPRWLRTYLIGRGLVVPATSKPAPRPSAQLYRWNRK